MKKFTTFATLAAAVVLLVTATFAQVPASSHVVLVMEENESASSVIGSSSAWHYLNSLATQYAQATNYYGNYHPSIDNYFMITAGINPANDNDSFTATVSADNIVRHMLTAGVTWKSYAQSLPSVGYTGGNIPASGGNGEYYIRHNPFAYFSDVRNSTNEAANIVPFTQFATDLAANQLPNLSYIVPDGLHDAHDGTPAQADSFLQTNLAPLLASPAFQPGGDGVLIIAFDEAATSDSTHGGGHIAFVMAGPNVKPGYKSTVLYQHQNLGRTIFEALGLSSTGYPGAIATAADMADMFVVTAASGSGSPTAGSSPAATGAPDFTLTTPAAGVTLSASGSSTSSIAITPENGFNSAVTLSCSGLPAGATCSFSPATVTPSGAMMSVTMTLNVPTANASSTPAHQSKPLLAFTLPFFGIAFGSLVVGGKTKKKTAFWVVLMLVLALGAVSIGCGGGSGKSSTSAAATQTNPPAGSGSSTYTITVNAAAGAIQHSTTLTVTAN